MRGEDTKRNLMHANGCAVGQLGDGAALRVVPVEADFKWGLRVAPRLLRFFTLSENVPRSTVVGNLL